MLSLAEERKRYLRLADRIYNPLQKIMICAPREITRILSEHLRQQYDVQSATVEHCDSQSICKIQAKILGKWITICRFSPHENLQDVLTMFKVNLQIQKRR